MEIFDLYNQDNQKLNHTMKRGAINQPGEYHKVVHVWIQRPGGDYLIQQRNKSTDRHPYQWAPTAGAVLMGETPIEAAIRETKEEIGLSIEKDDIKHIKRYLVDDLNKANYIIEQYLIMKDVSIESLTIDDKEVKQVIYASRKQIEEMIDHHQFWNFNQIDRNYLNELEGRHS